MLAKAKCCITAVVVVSIMKFPVDLSRSDKQREKKQNIYTTGSTETRSLPVSQSVQTFFVYSFSTLCFCSTELFRSRTAAVFIRLFAVISLYNIIRLDPKEITIDQRRLYHQHLMEYFSFV